MSDCLLPHDSPGSAIPIHAVTRDGLAGLALGDVTAKWITATGFKASTGGVLLVPLGSGAIGAVLLGLGTGDAADRIELLAGKLPGVLPAGTYSLAGGFSNPALATLAFALGSYRFTAYHEERSASPKLVVPAEVDLAEITRITAGVTIARDLINTPSNDMGPGELAAAAKRLASNHGATFSEIVGDELLAAKFPMIHAVGAAATEARAPRLIELTWGPSSGRRITLVGKGVCFDTGGLDIKPSSGMLLMKKDMGGAANVLGLAHMIMAAKLPVRLRVLIPAVENAIAGAAFRPGDILRSRKGLTVEIGNTDAEGRLILADALTYACEDEPELLVDLATLTGAARVALGPEIIPFYTRDDQLAEDVMAKGDAVSDPLWRMPLWAPYNALFESKVADLNNAGSSGHAGSITAALFLSRFVPASTRWLHADIFAWNPSSKPARPEGGEAQAIRALYALIRARYAA